jgi:hypothetical protein
MIASLGGYVIRGTTNPGPQTLWIGLQRTHDTSTAWNAFGPDSFFFAQPLVWYDEPDGRAAAAPPVLALVSIVADAVVRWNRRPTLFGPIAG